MLFEKSKIQDFRELVSYIMVSERAKIVNSALTTPNTVQNHDILHFWRGKLHLARGNMQWELSSYLHILRRTNRLKICRFVI